jgi:hypothetical protein
MIRHTIQDGEGLSLLADRHGLAPDTVWLHPENQALRALRVDGNTLHPGDVLFIPDKTPRAVDCRADATHRFVRHGVPAIFRIRLMRNGRPRAAEACVLEAAGLRREERSGTDGVVCFPVPPDIAQAQLTVGDDPPRVVRFGTLHTVAADAGVQRRLANLGLYKGRCDGRPSSAQARAVAELQRRCGLPETGALDAATAAALDELHDREGRYPEGA